MTAVRTDISIQESLFKEVAALAREMSIPRSQLFVLAVQEYLRRIRNRGLLKKINQAYSRIHTVVVCTLTFNLKRAESPGNVLLA